jgi:hypothetical protein
VELIPEAEEEEEDRAFCLKWQNRPGIVFWKTRSANRLLFALDVTFGFLKSLITIVVSSFLFARHHSYSICWNKNIF